MLFYIKIYLMLLSFYYFIHWLVDWWIDCPQVATDNFVWRGESIADEVPEARQDVIDAVAEIRWNDVFWKSSLKLEILVFHNKES